MPFLAKKLVCITPNTYSNKNIVSKLLASKWSATYENVYLEMSHVTFLLKNGNINKI